jgi:hypothetical protein
MVPLPTSGARLVNSLGDPLKTQGDAQRVIQAITAGTYPLPVSASPEAGSTAYQALFSSGFTPPAIEPNKGYDIKGQFRPMTDAELSQYTELRGKYLKQELSQLGGDATEAQAKAAYKSANQQALNEVGVVTGRGSPNTQSATAQNPVLQQASSSRGISSRGRSRRVGSRFKRTSLRAHRTTVHSPRVAKGRSFRVAKTRIKKRILTPLRA